MTHERIEIPLGRLALNNENDRHGPLDSEHACLAWMIDNVGDELVNLAKDIAKHGLSPLDGILVLPDEDVEGDYVVWEGNRRVAAVKLLEDPKRTINPKYRKKFTDIRATADAGIPSAIECTVANSAEEAERLIELRHQGPQKGVGTVPWSPAQKSRHQERLGKSGRYAFSQAVIDAFADKLDPELRDRVNSPDFAISTLDRLLKNQEVRDFLGITSEDGVPRRYLRREESVKGLRRMLEDVANGLPVRRVYDYDQQREYLDEFSESERPDHSKPLKDTLILEPKGPKTKPPGKKTRAHRQHPHKRSRLIPADTRITINQKRINVIYQELRQLELPRFTNAASVLLRVFLELATDAYLDARVISYNTNDSLKKKVQSATKDLKDQGWLTKAQAKGINSAVSAKDSPYSIDSFNSYVHNKYFNPSKEYLVDGWDNMEPYFLAVFDHL